MLVRDVEEESDLLRSLSFDHISGLGRQIWLSHARVFTHATVLHPTSLEESRKLCRRLET